MRNPFRRQAETAAPTLRERAANLRASLRQIPAASAALPAPGSPEAMAAWHSACNEHSKRSAPLHEYAELMDPEGGFWTKASLGRALETGGISVAEYARLHPMASERELRLDQIGHELNTAALFALAYADEYPQKPEAQDKFDSPADLTAAILDGWAAWGATTGFPIDASAEDLAPWEQASAKRDHLLYAAMALPATPESIEAKALACAWMEWVNAERPGQSRDDYGQADQLVYDIHATVMQRGRRDPNAVAPVPFTLSETALIPTVDFAGASMSELREIYKAAELVCEVASTATHNRHGRAGKLTRWVSNALCAVLTEAEAEARRRAPNNSDDRATRLSLICGTTLDNEDPAEIAAFARELLAMVEQ